MAPLQDHQHHHYRKVLFLYLALLFFTSVFITAYTDALPMEDEDIPIKKKTSTTTTTSSNSSKINSKNTTKLLKPTTSSSSKNTTKLMKTTTINGETATKNKTKLIKPTKDSVTNEKTSQFKKLNSTSKPSNSTKSSTLLLTNKSSDLTKTTSAKNKTTTTKTLTTKDTTKTQLEKNQSRNKDKSQSTAEQKPKSQKALKKPQPSRIDQDEDDEDLVAEFRDLPSKFQETFLPDLDRISKTSQVYLTRYNKEITKGVKPLVGNKYAQTIASVVSFAFIIIPLILVSLIFNRITAYFSLQKLLIFIQIYLSIYFTILCLSSLVTGLEPLKFFYATSQSTYVCLQVLQTLAYVLYLLLLLMYLVLVFSTETGLVTKLLGLGQTFVGFAVGLHYYMKVFHRAVLRQPPKTSWKVHALYATCFLVICLLSRADRRKKAYLEEGGEEGKKS